jgi:glycine/D-amino acid oxidase-like deaminating enzyme
VESSNYGTCVNSDFAVCPALVVGQGLAGTALAWRLLDRGIPVRVVDRDEAVTASKVAAGIVAPITGMRHSLSWRYDELYPQALSFYRRLEKMLRLRFFHPAVVVRLLRDEAASEQWARRLRQPGIGRYIVPVTPALDDAVFASPHGGFQQKHAAWLDTATYLEASRTYFHAHGLWQSGEVLPGDLEETPDGVFWQGRRYGFVIFCTGWQAAHMPWFDWVPFQSARGSILTLRADTKRERRIVSRGVWLQPRRDGTQRAGSTYEWDFGDEPNKPSVPALAGLKENLRAILRTPFVVTDCQTAVRPIIKGREALLGRHPAHPRIAFLNGLGSKGTLRAPWLAERLVSHLLDGAEIDAKLDLAGNL